MKYSPGPWKWEGKALCNEKNIVGGGDWDFSAANKRIIAAAPDLLEALQLSVKAMQEGRLVSYPEWYGVINKARAAIAKAIGEEE
ncbi:hypothetical protein [Cronobacter malonaticus]|uniref:hypothetical protein n=1 Tax=Cronobacter malonaticus TaxID=413503 RepID=UPI000CFDED14|nr:hypothetical protein [Cronobacter malonaticus]ELY5855612.1 hypothetical protein [Cronobacter malonaticus]WRU13687.1 hypothetical protein U9L39_15845 [Cronobacter malonaticus]